MKLRAVAGVVATVITITVSKSYPALTVTGIQAALAYAADLAHEGVLPLPA